MFFPVSKIFEFLIQPSHLLVWCGLAAAIALLMGRLHAGRILACISLLMLLVIGVFPTYVLFAQDHAFDHHPVPAHADGILVLAGGRDERVRLLGAYRLSRRYPEARVVYSGGSGEIGGEPDIGAAHARDLLVAMGLAPSRLVLEGRSRNTWENFVFTKQIVKPRAGEVWILAVPSYHMARSLAIARRVDWPMVPWPVDHYSADAARESIGLVPENMWCFDNAVHEWLGLLIYRLSGKASP